MASLPATHTIASTAVPFEHPCITWLAWKMMCRGHTKMMCRGRVGLRECAHQCMANSSKATCNPTATAQHQQHRLEELVSRLERRAHQAEDLLWAADVNLDSRVVPEDVRAHNLLHQDACHRQHRPAAVHALRLQIPEAQPFSSKLGKWSSRAHCRCRCALDESAPLPLLGNR